MHHLVYTWFMLLALMVFVVVRHFQPRSAELALLPWWQRLALGVAAFVGGALGAKAPFAFSNGEGWLSWSAWLTDGKTITTGLAGAYLLVELTKLALGVRTKTGDTFALPLALALVVGRWGCFCNGCCYGTPTSLPWGVDFGDGIRRHPTQIYESLFHFGMAVVLIEIIRHAWFRYQRLKLYLIAYGVYRFLSEYIRPEPVAGLGLTFYQWLAILLVVGMALHWLLDARRKRAEAMLAAA
jgi:phosphatidylglycerol:prolipoprotein diacylglycerol transferase